jgi:Predicted transporter component
VSTFTDGAPPSVSPEPEDPPGSPDGRERAAAAGNSGEQSGDWLQEEIRRRMAARAADGGGARHARRGTPSTFPGPSLVPGHGAPRHATPGPPPGYPVRTPLPPRTRSRQRSTPGSAPGSTPPGAVPPSRARRFDVPSPDTTAPQPAATETRPTPAVPPGEPPATSYGDPAVLHPALGGQAPQGFGAPARRPAFADPALLGDLPATRRDPATTAPVPATPDADDAEQAQPAEGVQAPRSTGAGSPVAASAAFRDGAAAGRAFAGIPGTAAATAPAEAEPSEESSATGSDEGAELRRAEPPAAKAAPGGPGLPVLGGQVRTGRPVPPAGPAAARLLSPPPSPPSTPTGIPLTGTATGGTAAARTPTPPTETDDGRIVAVPAQRGGSTDTGTEPPAAPAAGPPEEPAPPRRYVDYEDYDDEDDGDYDKHYDGDYDEDTADGADFRDPELEAAIAEVAKQRAADATAAPAVALSTPTSQTTPTPLAAVGAPTVSSSSEPGEPQPEPPKRVRVVLAERRSVARPVRTVDDVREGTGVGEVLRRGLIRSQLNVALGFAAAALVVLIALPLAFAFLPEVARVSVLGIRLPWLLLGGLIYPFLFGLGWWHARTAEKVEKGFADHVQG